VGSPDDRRTVSPARPGDPHPRVRSRWVSVLWIALLYLWVMPITLPASLLALVARLSGGSAAWHSGVLEGYGGPLPWLLRRVYPPMPIAAITLGHVVLASSHSDLERTRIHERVHVRQFERWGPLFPLVYVLASLIALLQGRDLYRDNWFEREARGLAQDNR